MTNTTKADILKEFMKHCDVNADNDIVYKKDNLVLTIYKDAGTETRDTQGNILLDASTLASEGRVHVRNYQSEVNPEGVPGIKEFWF